MKLQKQTFMCIKPFTNLICGIGALAAVLSIPSQAASLTLIHNNSTLDVNTTNAGAGVVNWTIDGVDQLNQNWFYYRVGSVGPEAGVQTIGTPTINSFFASSGQAQLDLTYANASFSVRTLFQLFGQNNGSGKSSFNKTITVQNLSGANLDFHFFQYADFNLGGVAGGQSVLLSQNPINGQFYQTTQTDGSRVLSETINSANPPIGHHQASTSGAILGSLTDASATTLLDTTSAGVGDVEFSREWDVLLAPGSSFQLSILTSVVPEPSSIALTVVSAGILALARRRRNKL